MLLVRAPIFVIIIRKTRKGFYDLARSLFKIIFSGPTIALIIIALLCTATTSFAALERGRYSTLEKIGFAFHTLSNSKPDFSKWVEEDNKYKKAMPLEKVNLMKAEMQRLQTGMITYDQQTDLIELNSRVRLLFSHPEHTDPDLKDPGSMVTMKVEMSDIPDDNFFPFLIGDVWVAVIIKDLEALKNIKFTPGEFQQFATKETFKNHAKLKTVFANTNLVLRPVSVDTSAPVVVNGIEMWLMLAEVAHMELWGGDEYLRESLWNYKAPWYMSAQEQDLRNLYWQD